MEEQDEDLPVDFVLVWDSRCDISNSGPAKLKRSTFEHNLEQEGIILFREENAETGLHFVKLFAPVEVLKRYAEILKLKLPMKKLSYIHEVKISSVPIISEVVEGVKSGLNRFTEPLMYDRNKIPDRKQDLTAVFSRDKEYLFDLDRENFFSQSVRARVIEFILKRKRLSPDAMDDFAFGIERALNDQIYNAAYPLHDGYLGDGNGMRDLLFQEWAVFRKILNFQPLDAVRDYFGVKVALYFAWLGFYTNLLIFPSIVGLVCFIYGLLNVSNYAPSREICEMGNSTFMCPVCDHFCDYWRLNETCLHSKTLSLFDNGSTVFFAMFMSIWAAVFLEFWKRYSSEMTHRWDTTDFTPEEEHPRPEYLEQLKHVDETTVNVITQTTEPKVPYWSRKIPGLVLSVSTVLLMILVVLSAVVGVILYRMSMILALSTVDEETIQANASLFISATGAAINLVCILIVNQIYGYVALWLTEIELNRTQTEFDDSLSLKIYILQFVNYYSSIFYIAFFKGQIIGYPGDYNRILGFRQEECSPGGCLMELCVQMGIIFVGKQFMMSIVEYYLPMLWKLYNSLKLAKSDSSCAKVKKIPQWVRDFKLAEWGHQGLFYEYLEMVIQYGFVTIFVSAFPLAPLFALINNIFELRLDAKKLLVHHRRPVAVRVKDIGVWLQIMEALGRISVVTNALIIAFTSEFIPKLVYSHAYSPDGSLKGYTNFTLSYFDPNHFETNKSTFIDQHPETCRYFDYRQPPNSPDPYKLTDVYWHILAARLAFVVIFQNVTALAVMAIKWIVPNMSRDLRERMRREAYATNEIIIRTELLKAQGKLFVTDDHTTINDETEPLINDGFELRERKPSETGDVTDGRIVM